MNSKTRTKLKTAISRMEDSRESAEDFAYCEGVATGCATREDRKIVETLRDRLSVAQALWERRA